MSSSPQLSLSGCSSLFSLSSTNTGRDNDSATAEPVPVPPSLHPLPPRRPPGPLLSLSVGGGCGEEEEEEEYLLGGLDLQLMGSGSSCDGDDERKTIRMMKNRESALRSRARKRAYVQELEKEVRRLVNENLKLKRQCKQVLEARRS
ncbi:bZIP transcription factor 27-like isoform X2 [Phragmites australis]|uniref:bZIP transcription factor 27-like isoform X2 n=1 Tax=Phragmites australis TaxID=29695 RepID=UPI002D7A14E8|nr:bZIP transcription factor 27-like isoform X2 [Phragmites australis]